jgi:hypothetical protein
MNLNLQFAKLSVKVAMVSLFSFFCLTSCGTALDPGMNLAISVSPEKPNVVPGKGVSCVSRSSAQASGTTASTDISADRIPFSKFVLQWRSNDKLTIAGIKVTIFSSGITGAGKADGASIEISEEELTALLGLKNLTIDFGSFDSAGKPVGSRVVTIDSTDTTSTQAIKTSTSAYAACGLQIGGLSSVTGIKTYTARIKIEVTGFSTACVYDAATATCTDGEQSPVRQSLTASAQKY